MIDRQKTLIEFLHVKGFSHVYVMDIIFRGKQYVFLDLINDKDQRISQRGIFVSCKGSMMIAFTINSFHKLLGRKISIEDISETLVDAIANKRFISFNSAIPPRRIYIDIEDFSFEKAAIEVDLTLNQSSLYQSKTKGYNK